MSDNVADLTKWALPAGASMAGHTFKWFSEVDDFHNPITSGFGLDKAGESLILSYLPGNRDDRVVDAVRFKGQENGSSLGRYPDGAAWWYALQPVTTNLPNSAPADHVLISEVMYHAHSTTVHPGDNANGEYIEIFNPTDAAAELRNAAGTWRMDGDVSYAFPSNTVIVPGAFLVLVGFDPATDAAARTDFLAAYSLTNGQIRLLGPWSGRLSNGSGRLGLERPQAPDFPDTKKSWVLVDEVIYSDANPWPVWIEGQGGSIARAQGTGSGNDPALWHLESPGSPGIPAPLIAIGYPAPYSNMEIPFSIMVSAHVEGALVSGTVQRVEIWLDATNKLGEATATPYEVKLDYHTLCTAGAHTLQAILVDAGGSHASAVSPFACTTTTRMWIASPADHSAFVSPPTASVQAQFSEGHVFDPAEVEFFANGTNSLGVSSNAPFARSLSALTAHGTYDLHAVLRDDFGSSTSALRRISVYTNTPTVASNGTLDTTIPVALQLNLSDVVELHDLPASLYSYTWTVLSGPGSASFRGTFPDSMLASFSTGGVYVVQFTLTCGTNTVTTLMTITVEDHNRPNTVRYEEPFDEYEPGISLLGIRGWYGTGGKADILTNDYAALYSNAYPLASAEHDQTLDLEGYVTNLFSGTATQQDLWVDSVWAVRHWIDEQAELDRATLDSQIAVAFNTNGNPMVWHCPDPAGAPTVKAWFVAENMTFPTGTFVRATINADYNRDPNGFFKFRLFLNERPVTNGSPWFACANTNRSFLSAVTFRGSTQLDDLVVDTASPFATRVIEATASGPGTIVPSGTIHVALNATTNFSMLPSNYYHTARVLVDGSSVGALAGYTFTNVTANHTIAVEFAEDLAAGQTPHWWLALMNPSFTNDFDGAELSDQDFDGLLTWEEYIAGTLPTDETSVFMITDIETTPTSRLIRWSSVTDRIYAVFGSTNLLEGWPPQPLQDGIGGSPDGTNTYEDTVLLNGPEAYRVRVRMAD